MITLKCDVYNKNDKIGRIEIINGKLIKNECYTNNLILHPCALCKTSESVLDVLRSRVISAERFDMDMAKSLGIEEYNAYKILKITHGIDVDDFNWFKFDGEEITYDDVKVRD